MLTYLVVFFLVSPLTLLLSIDGIGVKKMSFGTVLKLLISVNLLSILFSWFISAFIWTWIPDNEYYVRTDVSVVIGSDSVYCGVSRGMEDSDTTYYFLSDGRLGTKSNELKTKGKIIDIVYSDTTNNTYLITYEARGGKGYNEVWDNVVGKKYELAIPKNKEIKKL